MSYILADRYVHQGVHIIRARGTPSGDCVEVIVAKADVAEAQAIPGGGIVPCAKKGGKYRFVSSRNYSGHFSSPTEAAKAADEVASKYGYR
jgi:hypothetical protein